MTEKLISRDYDPVTGFTDEYYYIEPTSKFETPKIRIRRLQDVESNIDNNKNLFNSFAGKKPTYSDSGGLHKVASIPLVIIEKWMKEDGFNWFKSTDKERRAKLNSPEYRYLLTRPGKL